ncbi:MAG: hypothetical protein E6J78_18080 [Deltaproteobacteria bacterium]|nr:MAG: hypothetical protein E6J78_18080 [Deltaproteobacteria bacterium]
MKWICLGALLGCAQVSQTGAGAADAGAAPHLESVEPQPGSIPGSAKFTVRFSAQMDEGPLLAGSGRSETVVLAGEADVERVAAAIAHSTLSAHERQLLIPAAADIAADVRSIQLTPDRPLPAGASYLLVSPRLKDAQGRHLIGNGARFAYQVAAPPARATLISPLAGAEAPLNLAYLRASAPAGKLTLLDEKGAILAGPVEAQGETELALCQQAPCTSLQAGKKYQLALDGVGDDAQVFSAAACSRDAPPVLQGGAAVIAARDTSVVAQIALDWPARAELLVAEARNGSVDDGCLASGCASTQADLSCAPPPCGPQSFVCVASLRIGGLKPAADYLLRVAARDDVGFTLRGPEQKFSTVASLPRVILSEVMATPPGPTPRSAGEYVEILNLGPGAALVDGFAFSAEDGIVRPLLASPPPLPVQLQPGGRALAVGESFDSARYPSIPPSTPILRGSTRRLLGRGLHNGAAPFRLVLQGAVPIELSGYPGAPPSCPDGASLQRDESAPPGAEARWSCGPVGGTPGTGP